ncbi:glycerophosphodiester phosphodiesterase [Patulibacter sp.]|uniref:glycerophosphodiester phosphodiesterase n=1 Tax=Patulibacter sp. TaxID=1912859 RepID=UPI002723E178|nr:glycerophosphodiester phosphodiesterase [Patulibacter sp.]MDO9409572.1 glycerophosphodiester phosphodiesterase [Patulibacter sp.]
MIPHAPVPPPASDATPSGGRRSRRRGLAAPLVAGVVVLGLAVPAAADARDGQGHGSSHGGPTQGHDKPGGPGGATKPGKPSKPGKPTGPGKGSRSWERSAPDFGSAKNRVVYAHRGASGYRPEHTLEAYRLAIQQGADVIEPDLVSTKDGQLVDRHENEIGGTTDVATRPEFADRKRTKTIDGVSYTGWFTEDFTLKELRTLRAKERLPAVRPANTAYDGKYQVPTFQEVIDTARKASRTTRRTIAISPEIKHSTYFRSVGIDQESAVLRTLRKNRLDDRRAPVIVQSFEVANLKLIRRESKVHTVQLLDAAKSSPADVVAAGGTTTYGQLATPAGLKGIARYADTVSPNTDYVIPRDATTGASLAPTSFVRDAHAAGLPVVVYTFRRENQFLPLERRSSADPAGIGDLQGYMGQMLDLGVDALFTDNPDLGVAAVKAFEAK